MLKPIAKANIISSLVSVSSGLSAVVSSAVERHLSACWVFTYSYMRKEKTVWRHMLLTHMASCIFCIDFNFFIENMNIFNFLIFKTSFVWRNLNRAKVYFIVRLISLCPATKMVYFFNNRISPYNNGG